MERPDDCVAVYADRFPEVDSPRRLQRMAESVNHDVAHEHYLAI
jgi:hypothetical protein